MNADLAAKFEGLTAVQKQLVLAELWSCLTLSARGVYASKLDDSNKVKGMYVINEIQHFISQEHAEPRYTASHIVEVLSEYERQMPKIGTYIEVAIYTAIETVLEDLRTVD